MKVALVGHNYVLNDDYASLGVRKKLQKLGVDLITFSTDAKKSD